MAFATKTYIDITHLKDLWLHLCWSSLDRMPALPAHTTLSQAKYIALLRWLMVRQSLSTLSERWIALLAACSASTEFPRRKTVTQQTPVTTQLWCFFVLFFIKTASLTFSSQAHVCFQLTDGSLDFCCCPSLVQSVSQKCTRVLSSPVNTQYAHQDSRDLLCGGVSLKPASTLKVWKWHCLIKPESWSMSIIHNLLLEETENNSFLHLTCQIETKAPRLWQHLVYACMTRSHICVNALAEMEMEA